MNFPLVSVIITTKNEEKNIANCMRSVKRQIYPHEQIEIILVDNNSSDRTIEFGKEFADYVYSVGPLRSAQLNFGAKKAKGKYILYLDADMILSKNVISECVELCEKQKFDALYIPEKIVGNGYWIKVRDFERSFYTGTCIDSVRFVRTSKFHKIGGYDENLTLGADDWDFDRRIKDGNKIGIINAPLFHNEGTFELKRYLGKKNKYSQELHRYVRKWGSNDPEIKKQLGIKYRLLGVFVENGQWKKLLRYPAKTFGMYFLRLMVGITYLRSIT